MWGAFLTFTFHPVWSMAAPRSKPASWERTLGVSASTVISPRASSKK